MVECGCVSVMEKRLWPFHCPLFNLDGWSSSSLLFGELLCSAGESVWLFECCCLLFFKGLLALPWGYCSRSSYLYSSPACRLLTGTKWKPLLIVCRVLSTCFYCPWFSALFYSCFFFSFVPTFFGKPCCTLVTFYFFHKLPNVCMFNLITTVDFKQKYRDFDQMIQKSSQLIKMLFKSLLLPHWLY